MTEGDFSLRMNQLEELILRVERTCSGESLELARDLVRSLLDVHRGGLEELLSMLDEPRRGKSLGRALAERPAVASLLLMHDLHPDSFTERVRQAIEEANDASEGKARAELIGVDGNDVVVRVSGSAAGASFLGKVLERIVCERAPEASLRVEEDETLSRSTERLIPVERLLSRSSGVA